MGRYIVFHVWKTWEFLFRFFGRVRPLRRNEPYLFYIAKRRYLGRGFDVDGVTVRRFDVVVELHMNNAMLVRTLRDQTSLVGLAVYLLKETRRALPVLAERLDSNKFQGVNALYGITFIHRGVDRFGFRILPIRRPLVRRLATWHLTNVFRIVNPNAESILQEHASVFEPKMVAMSKKHLLAFYGPGGSAHSQTVTHPNHVLT
ncbi:MAG: hypothetical protein A2201_00135 [Alicyclobacillus sp. RIFOXYA1_FULL_53_8]|nr:MAG: hypothetical protein A2201_00135 [Alicyclobacillus sp. RIFOXYA1_FULL_53_8]